MNVFNATCSNRNAGVCVDQLVSLYPVPQRITIREPDVTFKFAFGFHRFTVDELFQPGKYESYFGECGIDKQSCDVICPSVSVYCLLLLSEVQMKFVTGKEENAQGVSGDVFCLKSDNKRGSKQNVGISQSLIFPPTPHIQCSHVPSKLYCQVTN
jgi:hypothetical protein